MYTIKEAYLEIKKKISFIYDAAETDAIANILLEHITKKNKAYLKAFTEISLNNTQQLQLNLALFGLTAGKPVQYITGYTNFYGLRFKVNEAVLIPRPETEELVEWVLKDIPVNTTGKILDMGTGSGCIPVSLKKNLPNADVYAIDLSADALKIAQENAAINKVTVNFFEADILHLQEDLIDNQYEVIISNPPYVTLTDKEQMHQNVLNFEPHLALFVPNENPLIFYHAIANFATRHLINNGLLFLEINENYGDKTINLLRTAGFVNINLKQDFRGKNRMIKATWKSK